MAIQNPCEDRREETGDLGLVLTCPPGKVRGPDGNCVDASLFRGILTTPPPAPAPEDPFAIEIDPNDPRFEIPRLPNPADPRDLIREGILSEIDYLSASRELTTIDESNFYIIDANIDLESRGMNHSSIWLQQKSSNQDLVDEVDRFRLTLLNFWNFNGEFESITVRPVGDPRLGNNSIQDVNPPGEGSDLARYSLLEIKSQPDLGQLRAYWSIPIDARGFALMENVPFQFYKPAIDRARREFPNETKVSHLMDMYMAGTNSTAWLLQNRQQFWQQNPDKFFLLAGGSIEYGKIFYDYAFDAPAAFFESEMNNIILSPFDSADVEVVLQNQDLHQDLESELEIPSVYQYYQSKQITNRINNDQILEENLPPGLVDFNQRSIGNYEEFTNENEFQTKEVLKFPSDKVELLEEINESIRGSLNNYAMISINTSQGGPINAMLQRNKMDVPVLQVLGDDLSLERSANERLFLLTKRKEKLFTKVLDDQFIAPDDQGVVNTTVNDKAIQNVQETFYRDIDDIISLNRNELREDIVWPRDLEEYPLYYTGWENDFRTKLEELIRSQIFLDQMNQHIEVAKLERSYADLLYGRKAYSEVIGYKVEKYRVERLIGQQESEVKVQEFLLMDNDNIERIEFLDTQILPDKKYKYKIFTINFVIGTKYEYNEQASFYSWLEADQETVRDDERGGRLSLNVLSGRSISLIYAPFFEKVVSAADKPPITPQVTFLPYQGIDNRYGILLQSGYGEVLEKPITVFRDDKATIQEIYRTQARRPGTEILYRSDSLPHSFEMIRIEEEPESYRDFDSPNAQVVSKDATGQTAFFMVDVDPNKYYYYTFRTVDGGGISNPTEVFRVRMVSYQNGIFMEMQPYEMYKKPEEFSMSFARALKISPNVEQKMIDFQTVFQRLEAQQDNQQSIVRRLRDELGLDALADTREFQRTAPSIDDIKLGKMSGQDSVWGKRFKLRCTSKTTGKKIDINFTFDQIKSMLDRE